MTEKQNLKWKWMENPITANQSQIKSYASDKHQLSHSHLMIDGWKNFAASLIFHLLMKTIIYGFFLDYRQNLITKNQEFWADFAHFGGCSSS